MEIILTKEQQNMLDYVDANIKSAPFITVGGVAGSGKSTCLSELAEKYNGFSVVAFTGKAANVLQRKGIDRARTIHSTIYKPFTDDNGKIKFTKRKYNELNCDGFLIDESSMLSERLFNDLSSYGMPLVFFGDHAQLEPIGSEFNLMKNPDIKLETIHRNANNIAKFAHHIRMGEKPATYKHFNNEVAMIRESLLTDDTAMKFEQIICGFNKSRIAMNTRMRKALGYRNIINKGEKIICLKNNNELFIFNGMQGVVKLLKGKQTIEFEANDEIFELKIDYNQFGKEKVLDSANDNRDVGYFDYAYCITCHKAQGDEFNSVCVIDHSNFEKAWDPSRWAYTAATRARKQLLWCLQDRYN